MQKIEKYLVTPYKISIFLDETGIQIYNVEIIFQTEKYNSLCYNIENQILNEGGFLDSEILKLENLINYLQNSIRRYLEKNNFDFSNKITTYLNDWLTYKILGLDSLMPLLLDDKVQEIYLDKPNTLIYIDHQDYGRCTTNIELSINDLEAFKTRLCLEKDTIVNFLNPSLKVELRTKKFHVRAAIDIPPLASDGFSMNVRKLRRKIWTLPELISFNMLTSEAAAYILFVMMRRNNLTIIGEPGSGKTTLANAFDLLTPSKWRKITVEDVIESINQKDLGIFQTRYSVSPFDTKNNMSSKSDEIIKLLHRSPTWVYLGEIQTAEHSRALFEALSAGLVGLQTCHGRSVEMMLIRWLNQHKIPTTSILTLDCLIETHSIFQNWRIMRNVFRIVEISKKHLTSSNFNKSLEGLELIEIFKFDSNRNALIKKTNLYNTPTMQKIRDKEILSEESFKNEFVRYKQLLDYLVQNKIYNPKIVRDFLNNFNKKRPEIQLESNE
ncbi:MAG: hypothetical protein EAX90_01105 [Candidatus Heimdallarchaeota archaeon]|nr:hypothetical protein [Candidatus Heimdallarchaeota archaeon]